MASFGNTCPKISTPLPVVSCSIQKPMFLSSFPVSESKLKPSLTLTAAPYPQGCNRVESDVFKTYAQLPEATGDKVLDDTPILKPVLPLISENKQVPVSANSLSAFMAQVTDLVKLVDSKDIVELELKQLDCEVVIRKKEALPQPSVANHVLYAPPPSVHQAMPNPQMITPSAAPTASPVAAAAPKPTALIKPKSSHPPFKSPMAGNFYRSSAPNSPPFVKVGDKVQKGQVLCIIEAMKLMNEIEADQSGSIVEILAEDGKPVGVDTPLFVIEP